MSAVDHECCKSAYPDLAGLRALVTGASTVAGRAIATALAAHHTRLLIQTRPGSTVPTGEAALLARAAALLAVDGDVAGREAAIAFAQQAAAAFGGLEVVVNVIEPDSRAMLAAIAADAVEDLMADLITAPLEITRVAANRMRLTLTKGVVINVLSLPQSLNGPQAMVAAVARSCLADMTRREAARVAADGVRVNMVTTPMPLPSTGPDASGPAAGLIPALANLALAVASPGQGVPSGLVLEVDGCGAHAATGARPQVADL